MKKFNEAVKQYTEVTKSGLQYEKDQYYPIVRYSYYIQGEKGKGRSEGTKLFLAVITPIGDKAGFNEPKDANKALDKFKKKIKGAREGMVDTTYIVKGGQVESMIKALSAKKPQFLIMSERDI